MQLCIVFCFVLLTCLALGNADEPKIFCYYRNWAVEQIGYARLDVSEVDPSLCTHFLYHSVGITEDGNVSVLYPQYDLPDNKGKAGFQKVNALRKQNEGLKILVSTSRRSADSPVFSKIAADTLLRSKYAKNVVDFLLRYEFDGFDINWQWPTLAGGSPDDVQNYVLLLKELRPRFDEHKLILSVTLEATEIFAVKFYDIPEISKYVDFIQLEISCHDSADKITGHNAPLYPAIKDTSSSDRTRNIDWSVRYWLDQGAPAEKLILCIRFYGLGFNLNNSAKHLPGDPTATGNGRLNSSTAYPSYNQICIFASLNGSTSEWDEKQRVPYTYAKNKWVSYDNPRSLMEKAQYVRSMGLGGASVWSLDQDDHFGECGERSPLIKALNRGLRGNSFSAVSESNIATTPRDDRSDQSEEDAKKTCARVNSRYLRHPQNCAKFWLCQKINEGGFNAKLFSCGNELKFDILTNTCKSQNLVDCN